MEFLYVILFVCYASYAYNRKCVSLSMSTLIAEGLDKSHAGLIISCQNIAFAGSKFFAGLLSDRLNPIFLFAAGIFLSAFATLTFSSSASIPIFCGLWFLNGLAQGCSWPSIAKILRQRAPPSQFGTLWSILSSSNNVSGSLGPLLAAFIIVHFGWRWNVFVAGFLSLSLGVFFLLSMPFLSYTPPLSKDKKKSTTQDKDDDSKVRDLWVDPYVWLLSTSFMLTFCARTTTYDWGQLRLMEEKGHSQYTASAFTSSVETAGFVGRLLAGYVTDWLIRRNRVPSERTSATRLSVGALFVCGSVIGLHLFRFHITEVSSPIWIVFVGSIMGISCYGTIAILGIVAYESAPPHLSGSSHAIVALFGNIGATVSGLPFSYIAKYYGWSTVFLALECLSVASLALLLLCRNRRPKTIQHAKQN